MADFVNLNDDQWDKVEVYVSPEAAHLIQVTEFGNVHSITLSRSQVAQFAQLIINSEYGYIDEIQQALVHRALQPVDAEREVNAC